MSEGLIIPFPNTPCGTRDLILSLPMLWILFFLLKLGPMLIFLWMWRVLGDLCFCNRSRSSVLVEDLQSFIVLT